MLSLNDVLLLSDLQTEDQLSSIHLLGNLKCIQHFFKLSYGLLERPDS